MEQKSLVFLHPLKRTASSAPENRPNLPPKGNYIVLQPSIHFQVRRCEFQGGYLDFDEGTTSNRRTYFQLASWTEFFFNTTSAYVNQKAKQQYEDSQESSEWHRLWAEKMATVSRVRVFFFRMTTANTSYSLKKNVVIDFAHFWWHFLRLASAAGRLFHQKSVPACCWSTVTMFVAGDVGAALSLGYLKHVFFILNSVGAHLHFWSFLFSI